MVRAVADGLVAPEKLKMLDLVRNHPPRHFTLSGVWKQLNQSKFLCRRPPGQRVPASDRDPVYESHPNIRLVSSNYRSMASPFPVSLYPRGITSRSIEIDNAVESDDISHHLLSEAIARDSDARWEAVSIRIGPYLATGRCRLDWRRRERPEVKWASSFEWWYITSDALPEGAQALVKAPTSLSGARTSRTMAPVHGPRETAMEKEQSRLRNEYADEQRKMETNALRQKILKDRKEQKDRKNNKESQ